MSCWTIHTVMSPLNTTLSPCRWRVHEAGDWICSIQTQTEKAQRHRRGGQSGEGPKTRQQHVGALNQWRGAQRLWRQHERPLSSSVPTVHTLYMHLSSEPADKPLLTFSAAPELSGVAVSLFSNIVSYFPTASIFTPKNPSEENMEGDGDQEEDDFQTDEDEEMEMEVDKQAAQKRKKVCVNMWGIYFINVTMMSVNRCWCCHINVFQVQGGGFQKKFRNNRCKSGRKKHGNVKNGK